MAIEDIVIQEADEDHDLHVFDFKRCANVTISGLSILNMTLLKPVITVELVDSISIRNTTVQNSNWTQNGALVYIIPPITEIVQEYLDLRNQTESTDLLLSLLHNSTLNEMLPRHAWGSLQDHYPKVDKLLNFVRNVTPVTMILEDLVISGSKGSGYLVLCHLFTTPPTITASRLFFLNNTSMSRSTMFSITDHGPDVMLFRGRKLFLSSSTIQGNSFTDEFGSGSRLFSSAAGCESQISDCIIEDNYNFQMDSVCFLKHTAKDNRESRSLNGFRLRVIGNYNPARVGMFFSTDFTLESSIISDNSGTFAEASSARLNSSIFR